MTTQTEFFQAHAVDGQLTDAQMAELLTLPEGDTGSTPEGGTPDAASVTQTTEAGAQGSQTNETTGATPPADPDPEKAVVLAKDGVHTIPYSKLEEARQGAQHWKAQAEAAAAELAALKAQAEQRAAAGQAPTVTDNQVAAAQAAIDAGVDPAIFGDFSEGDLAKGIQVLVKQQAQVLIDQFEAKLNQRLAPLDQKQAQDATSAHYSAIYEKHPDADSIAESKELSDWIGRQPSFVRSGYQAVLEKGTTTEIIELFDSFKAATGTTQPQAGAGKPDLAAAAKAALAKATAAVPASLSDFPGGTAGPSDEAEAMRNMQGHDLMAKLEGKTPEQIAAILERLV